MATVPFTLITPTTVALKGEASLVITTATEGEIGIMPGHAPFLTALKPGLLRVDIAIDGAKERRMNIATSAGFLQALPNQITILVDSAVKPEAVDVSATRAERTAALERQNTAGADREAYAHEQEIIDFADAKLAARG